MSQLYVVVYDFRANRLRNKCVTFCLDAGLKRVQLSVFCGQLSDRGKRRLEQRLALLLKEEENVVGCVSIFPLMKSAVDQLFCFHNPSQRSTLYHPAEALRDLEGDEFVI